MDNKNSAAPDVTQADNSLESTAPQPKDSFISQYASNAGVYSIESLEVNDGSGKPYTPIKKLVDNSPWQLDLPKRRALIVSIVIVLFIGLTSFASLSFLLRKSDSDSKSKLLTQQQDVSLKDTQASNLPSELQGAAESLLVNGDVVARGNIKISQNGFVSLITTQKLTANQTITLPAASGTLCVDSNNCSFGSLAQIAGLQGQIAALQDSLDNLVVPASGVESLNNQKGAVAIQGSLNRISVSTSGGVITLSTPQNLDANANVQFGSLTVSSTGQIVANNLAQTAAGNNININAGSDDIILTANGSAYQLPTGGPASQTICTQETGCALGAGNAVLLGQATAQVDGTVDASIFINDTGGGSLLRLQTGGVDELVVANNGDTTVGGSLTATNFVGDGASLTNINASNITSGTLSIARIADGSLTNAKLQNSSLTVTAGNGLINGGSVALGGVTTLNVGAGDGITVAADSVAVDGTVCRTTGNCAGAGAGVTAATPGAANRLAVFTAGQDITSSWLIQNGSTLELDNTRNLSLLGGNLNVAGTGTFTSTAQATRFISTVATGTAPLTVSSTTLVSNFNADLLDGQSGAFYQDASNLNAGTVASARITGAYNGLTGSTGLVTVGTITAGTWNGTAIADGFLQDNITISSAGTVDWLALNNYPAACPANQAITQLGDTITCQAFASSAGSGNYIQNQNAVDQTADFRISGSGQATTFTSTAATGTAPFTVASTTVVANLNADRLDGQDGAYYLDLANATGTLNPARIADGSLGNAKLTNSSLTVTAGTGLSGGGSVALGASTSLAVVYGSTANTSVQGNTAITITAGTGLTGGGSITLGAGGSSTLNVAYGSGANTAVQGNTQLTCASGTGNLSGGGNVITLGSGGACGDLTITNSPIFSGTLAVQGATATIGAVGQQGSVLLYDGGAGAAAHTGTVQVIGSLGQNTTYILPDPAAGSATICLSTGNCAGSGGGVTTPGGVSGSIAKFTGAGTIDDSTLSESGSTVTATGNLVIQGANSLTLGTSSSLDGSVAFRTAAGANTVSLQAPASNPASNLTFRLPSAYGANGDCLQSDGAGGMTFTSCTGGAGGGVTSIDGQTGVVTISNATGSGGNIVIDDATTAAKGIASFNSANFGVTGGAVSIAAGGVGSTEIANGSVTGTDIANATVTGSNIANATVANSNLVNSGVTVSAGTNLTGGGAVALGGTITLNVTNSPSFSGTLGVTGASNLDGGATIRGVTVNTATATEDQIIVAVAALGANRFNGTITNADLTANQTYTLPNASGTVCLSSGNCAGSGSGVTAANPGTANRLAVFTAGQDITSSWLIQNGQDLELDNTRNFELLGGNISANGTITGTQLSSTVATGTAPLTVSSTTLVSNFNSDLLDGQTGSFYQDASNLSAGTVASARLTGAYNGITGSTALATVGTITAGTWQGTAIADGFLQDNITVSNLGTVDWAALNNYPAACAAGSAVSSLGDTPTCTAFATGTTASYIQNQNSSNQTADFRISGTGRANTALQTPLLDTASGVALDIGTTNAIAINLNKHVTVATGQKLTIAGGNTASRAGLGATEGAVYYDTDTKQLLTYSNGKWQADRGDAIYVAASNSSQADKDRADYVGDGDTVAATDGDQVQINAALTAASGKKVVLLAGTYVADATILVPNNTILSGVGKGTIVEFGDIDVADNLIEATGSNKTGQIIRDMTLNGRKDLNTVGAQNGISFSDVGASNFRAGATVSGVTALNFSNRAFDTQDTYHTTFENNITKDSQYGLYLEDSSKNIIKNNIMTTNIGGGLYIHFNGSNNTITGNTVTNNTAMGLVVRSPSSTISNNNISGNTSTGISCSSSQYTTISNNIVTDNGSSGISCSGGTNDGYVTITGNLVKNNAHNGIYFGPSNINSVVSNNNLADNGSTNSYSAIETHGDNGIISGNRIMDTAGTGFAIRVTGDNTYLADNYYSGTGASSISDAGIGTIYGGQVNGSTNFVIQPAGTIELMKNTNVTGNLAVTGTGSFTGGSVTIATTTATDDRIVLAVASGGAARFDGTITNGVDLTAARTWRLPDATGTICLDATVNNCSYLTTAAAATGYIQNQFAGAQTADYWISGNARVGTNLTVDGNLQVGNGIPTVALNGEDAYIEGTLEVDSSSRFDGDVTVVSNFTTRTGNVAFQRNTTDYTATGTQDDINFGTGALFRITSASALTITSIVGGADGRVMTLMNASSNAVTINNDAGGTAANRIITGTGSNVTVPAGSSVELAYDSSASRWRIIGGTAIGTGNTASRANSAPNEGTMYYDTTTKQLLTYANGKWQADRGDAIYVAASNSSQTDKDRADYVGDGDTVAAADGDQVEINQALTAAAGKKVVLLAGTYTIDASISVPNNTTLSGVGKGTIITIPNAFDAGIYAITDSGTLIIRDLQLDGNKDNQSSGVMLGARLDSGDFSIVDNVIVSNWNNAGIQVTSVDNVTITNSIFQNNSGLGLNFSAPYGTITGNVAQGNGDGISVGSNNTVTGNEALGNTGYGIATSSSNSTISGNVSTGNGVGFRLSSSVSVVGNVVTGNVAQGNNTGIYLWNASYNTITGNTIIDSGGSTDNNGIYLWSNDSSSNTITSNTIRDTDGHTSTNYAIRVSSGSNTNYFADNTLGNGTINDAGTGTIYGGQVDGGNDIILQPTATTDFVNILGGSLKVGNGTPDVALNGEDLYVEGTLEVDGAVRFDTALTVTSGGTGITSYAVGDLLYASGATTLSKLAAVASGSCLISQGVATAPVWGVCSSATLQNIYDNSSPATVLLADAKNIQFTAGDTATDPSIIMRLNCTACGTGTTGNFLVQNNSSAALFSVAGSGAIQIGTASNGISLAGSGGTTTGTFTLSGTARNQKSITLNAEYAGAVLNASGDTGGPIDCSTNFNGSMTTDFDTVERMNTYQWTSDQATGQCYDVVAQVKLPSDWDGWAASDPINIQLKRSSTGGTAYAIGVVKSGGGVDSNYGAAYTSPGTLGTTFADMATSGLDGSGYAAGDTIFIKIRMQANQSGGNDGIVYLGTLTLNYLSKF